MNSSLAFERDPSSDSYWIYGGFLLAMVLHRGSFALLTHYCADTKRFRLTQNHFSDLAMKMARVVYYTLIGIVVFTTLASRLTTSSLPFPRSFFADVDWWSGAALVAITFDVYELGHLRGLSGQISRIGHHLLELTITLLWLAFEPSPMLIFAGGYVVVANVAFLFPVLMRVRPHSQTRQELFATIPIVIIMGSVVVTDAAIASYLLAYWGETLLWRKVTAVIFALGFTSLDGALCKFYFHPLVLKARNGELYSPPPKHMENVPGSSSKLSIDDGSVCGNNKSPDNVIAVSPDELRLELGQMPKHDEAAAARRPSNAMFDLPTDPDATLLSKGTTMRTDASIASMGTCESTAGRLSIVTANTVETVESTCGEGHRQTVDFFGMTAIQIGDFGPPSRHT